jgi:hypothetical protein
VPATTESPQPTILWSVRRPPGCHGTLHTLGLPHNAIRVTTRSAVGGLQDNPQLHKAEDLAESKADDGGTVGAIADKADDVIDQIQGTKD